MKKGQDYDFYITIKDNFEQKICFSFYPENLRKFSYLDNQIEFSSSQNVQDLIDNIEKVLIGKTIEYYVGAEDALEVHIYKNKIIAQDIIQLFGYDKLDKTEHSTLEFLHFLKEWKVFIEKYENNEIPNLNNPNSTNAK